MIELFVTETSYGLLPVAHELVLRCRRYERFGIGPRKLVHRHHGLGGFDLPHGAEFLEFAERIYRYHAVLKQLCYFIAYAVEQPTFITDSRSEEHTSELQSLMRISYAVFCLKQKNI